MIEPDGNPSEETKTFSLTTQKFDIVRARMGIAAAATECEVRIISIEEKHSRVPTYVNLDVTMSGHPKHVRDFHERVGGGDGGGVRDDGWWLWGGDGSFTDFVISMTVDNVVDPCGVKPGRSGGRATIPLPGRQPEPGSGDARTTIDWTWKQRCPTATRSALSAWTPTTLGRSKRQVQKTGRNGLSAPKRWHSRKSTVSCSLLTICPRPRPSWSLGFALLECAHRGLVNSASGLPRSGSRAGTCIAHATGISATAPKHPLGAGSRTGCRRVRIDAIPLGLGRVREHDMARVLAWFQV